MMTGQFVMNATVSLVDRSDDGWSVFVFLLISRWRSCRYLPDTVDRTRKRSVSDLPPH